ncbi:uncharacterized protein EV422DRAFT_51264 [Fimicolochytrium jonesii]|uniref:uncharacterized protein n=1 Tax=Fimicolochytrium jonesii TaxID=1396493 RepID=UPI0022FE9847|nr:uncharacterized protein EV422DRAFT_51264 [Fimicolochytrium jonesii]KAI8821069.1 hypothetical protein EV422DRAFT_51264 [Fimicolochytrium jonesii]
MFIGGLNWETTDESMRTYFEKFGEVEDCVVMKDPVTGRSRGFGFLTFKDPRSVEEVVQLEHTLDGKIIDPKRAIPREEQEKTEKIFVGGVGPDVTEDQFREYFMQFGKVIDATLMIDRETGRPRGFGFITFENSDGVDKAMAKQSLGELAINEKTVEVKRAMPKHKIPQSAPGGGGGQRYGRPDSLMGGDSRGSNFGPMRSRMGYGGAGGGDAMGMGSMGRMGAARYGFPGAAVAGGMGYGRYGMADAGAGGYGSSGFGGYGMHGRYAAGFGGMEGFSAAYGRNPAAMAAYYQAARAGGYGASPYGYGYPAGYGYGAAAGGAGGDMFGRYGAQGGHGGQAGFGRDAGYRRTGGPGTGDDSPTDSPGRGSSSRGYGGVGSPGQGGREDETDSVALAGGDVDVKPIMTPSGPRFDRERERDYGSGGGERSRGGSGARSHGYHPYAR